VTAGRLADAVGAGLVVLVAAAVLLSTTVNDAGSPWPVLTTLSAAAVAYAVGRVLAPIIPAVALLAVGALVVYFLTDPLALAGAATVPPLWYANANAAFYVQVGALAAVATAAVSEPRWRTATGLSAAFVLLLNAVTGSLAGFVTGLGVLIALLWTLLSSRWPRRGLLVAAAALVLAAHLTALALGAAYQSENATSATQAVATSSLSERRLQLWGDAVNIASDHPLIGIGSRQFRVTSPTALADPDTAEAHSATLQMAAETGWAGGAALLCLLVWAAIRPLIGSGADRALAVITAAAMTGLALHAAVDYVLSFPVVAATAALVLGVGTARLGVSVRVAETSEPRRSQA
jgi:O-antigen ligase